MAAWSSSTAVEETPDSDPAPPRWGAFSYPNYRRFWFSTVARVFGMQFRFIGGAWLVHELTDSAFWLGVPGVVSALVTIALTVPAGALADRVDTRRLLIVGQTLTTVAHLVIAILTVAGLIEVWMVLVWSAVTGALVAITNPAQNAMLPRLIDRSAMVSAVAYTSAVWNSMRIIGPAAAGVVIAFVGIGQAFFVTTAGFAISTLLIATLRLEPRPPAAGADSGMLAGVRYIFANPIFLAVVGLSFFTSIFGMSYVVLLPIFADDILHSGAQGFGFMEARRRDRRAAGDARHRAHRDGTAHGHGDDRVAALFGVWIAAFAVSRSLPLSMALLFASGFVSSLYLNLGMTTLQLLVPDALRGRVMGVWSLTWFLSQLGGFFAASAAELLGTPLAVALGALSVAVFAIVVYVAYPQVRAIRPAAETAEATAAHREADAGAEAGETLLREGDQRGRRLDAL